jgi:hypothetical protein
MKIWNLQTQTATHTILRFNCEEHSDLTYLGEFSDESFQEYLHSLDLEIDTEKNLKLLKYYGYAHLLLKRKS